MTNETENKIIVAFHIGRGGRFNNPGHKTFIGEKNLQDLIVANNQYLYEVNRDEKGRFCKPYLADQSGKTILDAEDLKKEVGCLEFDGTYDTDCCCYIDDCSDEEIDIIFDSHDVVSFELTDYILNHYREIGDDDRLEQAKHLYGWRMGV